MASAPSAALTSLDQQIVFWKGTDGVLHEMWWDPRSGWNGPVVVNGGVTLASRPSVMVTEGNQVLFWESLGGDLEEMWWNSSSGWNGPVSHPPRVGHVLGAVSDHRGRRHAHRPGGVLEGFGRHPGRGMVGPPHGWNGPIQVPGPLPMGSGPSALVDAPTSSSSTGRAATRPSVGRDGMAPAGGPKPPTRLAPSPRRPTSTSRPPISRCSSTRAATPTPGPHSAAPPGPPPPTSTSGPSHDAPSLANHAGRRAGGQWHGRSHQHGTRRPCRRRRAPERPPGPAEVRARLRGRGAPDGPRPGRRHCDPGHR